MGIIKFNGKKVSDKNVVGLLEKISHHIGPVNVTSGDRGHVPRGGSVTSLHLIHQAVDFWVSGVNLEDAFKKLIEKRGLIFAGNHKYEVIHHGKYTHTGGPHLHIGRYPTGKGVIFKQEGTTEANRGRYSILT